MSSSGLFGGGQVDVAISGLAWRNDDRPAQFLDTVPNFQNWRSESHRF